ncbi:nucleotidyltransferase family protein [Raoultibacter phocaeensis]|uniref:nucleotidyltransferase family protein n=1 Tax=Raoultibacter phocaeensis TaxID=2479841 RepID=UPI00111B9CE2|nr:nucleotidyltransferase domain-containing protein [Raoultibacter phocaeensis]
MVDIVVIGDVLSDVLKDYDIREAYVYGSYARGDQSDESDIDLRFLCGEDMSFAQLLDIQKELENRLGKSLDIATAPPHQMRPSFYNRIKEDEVLLYETS